jgi:hypothetical protein
MTIVEEKNYTENQSHDWLSYYPVGPWNGSEESNIESPVKGNRSIISLFSSRKRMYSSLS